jgi:hypothetical protein
MISKQFLVAPITQNLFLIVILRKLTFFYDFTITSQNKPLCKFLHNGNEMFPTKKCFSMKSKKLKSNNGPFCDPKLNFVFLSWLPDKLHFILSYEAGFCKPTVLKVHPSFCRITAYATMPG